MNGPDADTLMFFNEHPQALPLYEHLEEILFEGFPDVSKRVQKTQITFSNRHVFACVSFAKVKRKRASGPVSGGHTGTAVPAGIPSRRGEDGTVSRTLDHPFRGGKHGGIR